MDRTPAPEPDTSVAGPDPVLTALARAPKPHGPQMLPLELDSEGQLELGRLVAATKRRLQAIEDAARERLEHPDCQQDAISVGVLVMHRPRS